MTLPNQPNRSDRAILWLRRGDRLVVGLLSGLGLLILGWHWGRLTGWGEKTVEIDRLPSKHYQYEIDINKATWVEWSQFEGIGESFGKRIVADRDQNGDFETIDDLLRVRGIGKKRLETMRPHLRVEYAARPHRPDDSSAEPPGKKAKKSKKRTATEEIDESIESDDEFDVDP